MAGRILAIRPGGVGDCLLSFPALQSLPAKYLEVWVPGAVVPLVQFAGAVRAISNTGLDLLGLPGIEPPPKLLDTLASFDVIHSWYGTNRADFRDAMAQFPVDFHPALPPADCPLHAADFFAAQLGAPMPAIPRVNLDSVRKRGFVAIHPFSGSVRKNWPLEDFQRVAKALDPPVEWCATQEQSLGSLQPVFVDANLMRVACWLAEADLYIGNDSGITHLAAAVGTPVVALFQASDSRLWAPRGRHVRVLDSPRVEGVLTAVASCR